MTEAVRVRLRFYGHIRQMTGSSTIQAEFSPVLEDALVQIDQMVGADLSGLLKSGVTLLLNSEDVNQIALDHRVLRDGDTLSFIPPVRGGLQSEDESDDR